MHFDRVLVQFPGRTDPALDRWTGTIAHGQLTVVTGPSGCGKSTLLSLLTGQLIAEEGRVLAGTVDLASVDPQKWRRHLAWVPQVPAVIDGTVADNVRWGVAASDQQVQAALHDAGAADLVLDRRLVEQGDSVSAGQRRRLAVARALLRVRVAGASVVLLDEPTAGLDETREHQVLQSLRELGVMVVVVSHRAASIDLADRVIDLSEQASEVALTC